MTEQQIERVKDFKSQAGFFCWIADPGTAFVPSCIKGELEFRHRALRKVYMDQDERETVYAVARLHSGSNLALKIYPDGSAVFMTEDITL